MDDYGNDVRIALVEQRVSVLELAAAQDRNEILGELKLLRQEISEARGGLRFGKWLAGILLTVAALGTTIYQVIK